MWKKKKKNKLSSVPLERLLRWVHFFLVLFKKVITYCGASRHAVLLLMVVTNTDVRRCRLSLDTGMRYSSGNACGRCCGVMCKLLLLFVEVIRAQLSCHAYEICFLKATATRFYLQKFDAWLPVSDPDALSSCRPLCSPRLKRDAAVKMSELFSFVYLAFWRFHCGQCSVKRILYHTSTFCVYRNCEGKSRLFP